MRRLTLLLTGFACTLFLTSAAAVCAAQGLPTRTSPVEAGFSAARLDHITKRLKEDADKGLIPGSVLMIMRRGKLAYFDASGVLDPATKAPMTKDALFRIYSMSKPVTTVAAMMLVEEGKLALNDPLAKFIPAFGRLQVGVEKTDSATGKPTLDLQPARRPITIQDLMRHTSGITYGFFGMSAVKAAYREAGVLKGDYTNEEFAARIAKLPLHFQPGTTWDYSHSTDILGRVVEIVSGKSLFEFEKERLFSALGMNETSYYVTDPARQKRLAEPFPNDRTLGIDAQVGDPRVAGKWESGGGGLVSTAADYSKFLQMMLAGGALNGKRYISPKTVAFMTSDHMGDGPVPGPLYLPGPGYGFGLGFAVRRANGISPDPGTAGDYYWNGAAGTSFWVDPKEDMYVLFLIQAPKQLGRYKVLLRDMIYGAIEK